MGERSKRYLARRRETQALAGQREAMARSETAEETRGLMEGMLGSREQVMGNLGASAAIQPYTQRYSMDQEAAGVLGYGRHSGAQGMADSTDMMNNANALMQQAQEAAESGDMAKATQLRGEAETLAGRGVEGGALRLEADAEYSARAGVSSVAGQTVGALLQRGRQFAVGEGEEVDAFKRSLTEGGERALAVSGREQAASARRDALSQRGLGAGARQAIGARSAANIAQQKAQLRSQAGAYYEQARGQIAQQGVQMAREFVSGAPGVRDAFLDRMNALQGREAGTLMESSARYSKLSEQAAAKKQATKGMIIGAVAGIAGALTGGLGAGLIGTAAKMFTGGAKGAAGGGGGSNISASFGAAGGYKY